VLLTGADERDGADLEDPEEREEERDRAIAILQFYDFTR
jgi:hypothetical protein